LIISTVSEVEGLTTNYSISLEFAENNAQAFTQLISFYDTIEPEVNNNPIKQPRGG
jgi:hypothetical protein